MRRGMLAAAMMLATTACAAPDSAPEHIPQASTASAAGTAASLPTEVPATAQAPTVRAKAPPTSSKDPPVHAKVPVSPTAPDAPGLPPGERLDGSGIFVPRSVRAGEALSGRVPPGSRVELDGRSVKVDPDGGFHVAAPDRSTDAFNLKVFRPDDSRPAMTFRIRVIRD